MSNALVFQFCRSLRRATTGSSAAATALARAPARSLVPLFLQRSISLFEFSLAARRFLGPQPAKSVPVAFLQEHGNKSYCDTAPLPDSIRAPLHSPCRP